MTWVGEDRLDPEPNTSRTSPTPAIEGQPKKKPNELTHLISLLAVRHGVRVPNLYGAVRGDGPEQGSDDALLLVVTADIRVGDVKEHGRVELRDHASVARRHVQHSPPHSHWEWSSGRS